MQFPLRARRSVFQSVRIPFSIFATASQVLKELSKNILVSGSFIFVAVAALVVLTRITLLNVSASGSSSIVFGTGFLSVLVFGTGCAFLGLALRSMGTRDAIATTIALSLLPVAFLDSVVASPNLLAISVVFAALYLLTLKNTVGGAILAAIAASLDVLTLLSLIVVIPFLGDRLVRGERAKFFWVLTTLVVFSLLLRIVVELIFHDAVSLGVAFESVSSVRLFRVLTFEGYGVLGLMAFAATIISVLVPWFWKRMATKNVWWYVAGAGVSGFGMLVLNPKSNPLIMMALFLLMISTNVFPRLLNWCVLLFVAASPFFFMISHIPLETTLYSNSSATLELKNRRLYIDVLQGPILFERARLAAWKDARQVESKAGVEVAGMSQTKKAPMWLTAYYPVWSIGGTNTGISNPMYPHEMNWQGLTHIIHFNIGPDSMPPYWHPSSSHTIGTANTDSMEMFYAYGWRFNTLYMMIDSLRKYARANNVKLLLSVGGIWGAQASAMDYITSDSTRTQTFANAALAFASRNGYDGIEIDWEPPRSEEQMSMLTRIMKRRMTAILGNSAPLVLAACFECGGAYGPELQDSIAQYNFMMYDMHQPFNSISSGGSDDPLDVTGFNAPLFPPDEEKYPVLSSWEYNYEGSRGGIPYAISPRKFIRMGFPPSKIGMGVPFYGYVYPGKSAPNQPRNGVWPQYLSYIDCMRALRIGGTRNWEEKARVPWMGGTAKLDIGWMVKSRQQFYITYDDSASLREKVLWAKQLGLGGVMVYELWTGWLSTEPPGKRDPLLRSVVEAIREGE